MLIYKLLACFSVIANVLDAEMVIVERVDDLQSYVDESRHVLLHLALVHSSLISLIPGPFTDRDRK